MDKEQKQKQKQMEKSGREGGTTQLASGACPKSASVGTGTNLRLPVGVAPSSGSKSSKAPPTNPGAEYRESIAKEERMKALRQKIAKLSASIAEDERLLAPFLY